MTRFYGAAILVLSIWLALSRPCAAGQTAIDLSAGPLLGTHAEIGAVDTIAPVPIPILSLSHRESIVELYIEGLPVSPPISSASGVENLTTHLTFANGVIRAYLFGDRISLGAGETIYNQDSTYSPFRVVDTSRVVGGRYELAIHPLPRPELRVAFDVDPVLTGNVTGIYRGRFTTRPAPERGSQVDVNAGYRREFRITQLEYGIRYINYVSHFTRTGALAARNTGFLRRPLRRRALRPRAATMSGRCERRTPRHVAL